MELNIVEESKSQTDQPIKLSKAVCNLLQDGTHILTLIEQIASLSGEFFEVQEDEEKWSEIKRISEDIQTLEP